jgi:SAM-dependent methyltransferase
MFWFGIVFGQAALLYALLFAQSSSYLFTFSSSGLALEVVDPAQLQQLRGKKGQKQPSLGNSSSSSSSSSSNDNDNDNDANALWAHNPLAIPPGQPPNLPRIEVRANHSDQGGGGVAAARGSEADVDARRGTYGGKGDGKHLGGFTAFDRHGVSPGVWAKMITELGVKSVMDVGCGRGISTRWFLEHQAKVLCVEGSHDAVTQSFLPPEVIVEHDYSRGPWWPRDTYDAAWSVEFLEHVSRQYLYNYVQTLRKAAVIFVTSSRWSGWHHVEIHNDEWWIRKFTSFGFVYDDKLTQAVKGWAIQDKKGDYVLPTGKKPQPQHISLSMKVFVNPAVASLPAHAHLFGEDGCLGEALPKEEQTWTGTRRYEPRRCGTGPYGMMETPLKESMLPLVINMTMHERWVEAIRAGLPKQDGNNNNNDNDEPSSLPRNVSEGAAATAAAVTR